MRLVKPARIKGSITAPASKSMAQRLLLLCSQLNSESVINLGSLCDDIVRCSEAVEGLGSKVIYEHHKYQVFPNQRVPDERINCGESGTCFRMIAALCARYSTNIELVGEGSLINRPMHMIEDALNQLQVNISSNQHKLPLNIFGPVKPSAIEIDGSISSQFLSGLLITLPFCSGQFVVKVNNLKSRPYVQLTLDVLKSAGIEIHYSEDLKYFQIEGPQIISGRDFDVEGDWSSIATMMVAGAVAGELKIDGVQRISTQADRKVVEAIESAGAELSWSENQLTVKNHSNLQAFEFDAEDCPDSIPALVALAINCEGTSRISGALRLKHKESDRATALCTEYAKLGAKVRSEGNFMIIEKSEIQNLVTVNSHNDHRIAMSLAIAALNSAKGIEILEPHVVTKSYPQFFADLESVCILDTDRVAQK